MFQINNGRNVSKRREYNLSYDNGYWTEYILDSNKKNIDLLSYSGPITHRKTYDLFKMNNRGKNFPPNIAASI